MERRAPDVHDLTLSSPRLSDVKMLIMLQPPAWEDQNSDSFGNVFNFTMYSKLFSFRDKYQRCPFWLMTHNIFHFILYLTKKQKVDKDILRINSSQFFGKCFQLLGAEETI